MNVTRARIVLLFCLITALVSMGALPVTAFCENLRFIFLADSRSDKTTVADPLLSPVNTPVLNAIITQIGTNFSNQQNSPNPSFMMFAGDMSYRGYIKYESMDGYTFQNWKNLFAPLTGSPLNIPLYTAIGNHELYSHGDTTSPGLNYANQQQYQQVFSENPINGPTNYEHLTYSFTSPGGDAFFAVLDPYYLTADLYPYNISGTIDQTQLTWLQAQIAQTTATHKFLFIHTPYYYVTGTNPNDPSEAVEAPDATYTALWNLLDSNNFDAYFCGHSHLFSRKTIDSSVPPQIPPPSSWQNNVVQLLNGAGGAPVDSGTPTVDPVSWNVHQAPNTYYFTVVDINGPTVTFSTYSGSTGSYTVCDSFTLDDTMAPVPEPATLLLVVSGGVGLLAFRQRSGSTP